MDEVKNGIILVLSLLGLFVLGYVITLLAPVITPFLVALFLAYLANPVVNKLTRIPKLRIPRSLAVGIVFMLIILILIILSVLIAPLLQKQVTDLIKQVPALVDWFQNTIYPLLQQHFNMEPDIQALKFFKEKAIENLDTASNFLIKFWKTILQSGLDFVGWLINLGLVFVVSFYLMRDWEKCVTGMKSLLPPRFKHKILSITKQCDETLKLFFSGQIIVVLCLMFIYSFGLALVGVKYSLLLGISAGALSIVPYLGGFIGLAMSCVFAIFQSHEWGILFQVICVFGVGQLVEGMVLTPVLIGDKLGLHPVAVIFAVLAGGQLFGFVGILLALPVTSILVILFREHYNHYVLAQS